MSRFLPLARLRERTPLPPRVFILARNPWVRFFLRVLG
jgi:hypothetical protein